jgi:hypothetical protein
MWNIGIEMDFMCQALALSTTSSFHQRLSSLLVPNYPGLGRAIEIAAAAPRGERAEIHRDWA